MAIKHHLPLPPLPDPTNILAPWKRSIEVSYRFKINLIRYAIILCGVSRKMIHIQRKVFLICLRICFFMVFQKRKTMQKEDNLFSVIVQEEVVSLMRVILFKNTVRMEFIQHTITSAQSRQILCDDVECLVVPSL